MALTTTWRDVIVWDTATDTWWPVLVTGSERVEELRWGSRLDELTLVISAGDPIPGLQGEVRVKRYVLFRPARPEALVELPVPGREVNSVGIYSVLCWNGDLLYTAGGNWPSAPLRLYRHAPGDFPRLLFSSENLVLPLGCP
ncbi:MAG: hypothetical protein Q9O62_05835 [Ardenticatenia bacterium]|nr:hypothetical protein [Ardenticatenia bacterium]